MFYILQALMKIQRIEYYSLLTIFPSVKTMFYILSFLVFLMGFTKNILVRSISVMSVMVLSNSSINSLHFFHLYSIAAWEAWPRNIVFVSRIFRALVKFKWKIKCLKNLIVIFDLLILYNDCYWDQTCYQAKFLFCAFIFVTIIVRKKKTQLIIFFVMDFPPHKFTSLISKLCKESSALRSSTLSNLTSKLVVQSVKLSLKWIWTMQAI